MAVVAYGRDATRRAAVLAAGRAHLIPLAERLLDDAGAGVLLPSIEEDAGRLLARGRFFSSRAQRLRGAASRCHRNVAAAYRDGARADGWRIATGYALPRDGTWRQHSWLVRPRTPTDPHPEKLETTAYFARYYGYVLDDAEAEDFVDQNQG